MPSVLKITASGEMGEHFAAQVQEALQQTAEHIGPRVGSLNAVTICGPRHTGQNELLLLGKMGGVASLDAARQHLEALGAKVEFVGDFEEGDRWTPKATAD